MSRFLQFAAEGVVDPVMFPESSFRLQPFRSDTASPPERMAGNGLAKYSRVIAHGAAPKCQAKMFDNMWQTSPSDGPTPAPGGATSEPGGGVYDARPPGRRYGDVDRDGYAGGGGGSSSRPSDRGGPRIGDGRWERSSMPGQTEGSHREEVLPPFSSPVVGGGALVLVAMLVAFLLCSSYIARRSLRQAPSRVQEGVA